VIDGDTANPLNQRLPPDAAAGARVGPAAATSFAGGAHTCFACHEVVKSRDLVFNRYAP
jgi:hypothetical protein